MEHLLCSSTTAGSQHHRHAGVDLSRLRGVAVGLDLAVLGMLLNHRPRGNPLSPG
jgi:hypothetical protein